MENKSKLEHSEAEKGKGKSKCPICKEDATLVCGGCQAVSYCCLDHQKKHWKLHQSSCVFFHIKNDPSEFTGAGKYCVASRDLKAGTLILEELPLFQVPSNDIHDDCITCGIDLPPKSERNASHSCPECNWPVCGTACAQFPLHAANECKVFVSNRSSYDRTTPDSPTSKLESNPVAMRAYAVMMQNPLQWKELMEMLEWGDIGSRNQDDAIAEIHYNDTLEKIDLAPSHFPRITIEDKCLMIQILHKLIQLTSTQGYGIWIHEESEGPGASISNVLNARHRTGAYVYKTARHFTHSCSPNCFWTVGTFPDFKMQLRTSVTVKKGEKLTVSRFIYDVYFAHGTRNRQKEFQSHFQSPCRCDLCLDPTEFGTNQSAVVCELCKTDENDSPGYLLPVDPLNIADDAPWTCNKCMKITIASKFCGKLDEITIDLQNKCQINLASADKVCEAFIEMYQNKLVHPNHWLIHLATKHIRSSQIPRLYFMNAVELSGFEKRMCFLLDLKNKIVPGIIHDRIMVLYYLSLAMCNRLLITFEPMREFYKELHRKSSYELLPIISEVEKCQQYQNEVLLYCKDSPNIGRGQTKDHHLSTLRSGMKFLEVFKAPILIRLAEIELQRLRLGIN